MLNGRPYQLRMVLDQGYWPESGLTAPTTRRSSGTSSCAKAMGFNGVRKHQKIEDPRYLYWADRLGLLVWEEMPSAYRFTRQSVDRLTREWIQVIDRDASHPCIVAWVPFNESWGVPDLPDSPAERALRPGALPPHQTLDPTRPVIGNDGWESVATDIIGIHDYDDRPRRIARRYHHDEVLPRLFKRARPGGRLLVLEHSPHQAEQPDHAHGVRRHRAGARRRRHVGLLPLQDARAISDVPTRNCSAWSGELALLAGFCYTQFADTYQEANGLLYADRTPKVPLALIAAATSGGQNARWASLDIDALIAQDAGDVD